MVQSLTCRRQWYYCKSNSISPLFPSPLPNQTFLGSHLNSLSFKYTRSFKYNNRDLRNNSLSGVLPSGMCSQFYPKGCSIATGRFTTNCNVCNYQAPTTTSAIDTQALKDFYTSTNGSGWISSQNWPTGDPCKSGWFGVTCDASLSVLGLDLTNNNIAGPLPSSIGNLMYLNKLALGGNGVQGFIPSFFSSMFTLTNLTLSYNRIGGSIPTLPAYLISMWVLLVFLAETFVKLSFNLS